MNHFGWSPTKAILDAFPDIALDERKFIRSTLLSPLISSSRFLLENYWSVVDNRKQLFYEIAKRRKFDPLIPENWYWLPNEIHNEKVYF